MDDSVLERFFDSFIANDAWTLDYNEELCLRLLPDELLTLQDNAGGSRQIEVAHVLADSSASLDYSSQNSTATAQLPSGLSEPSLLIQNVMSTANLGCPLDLDSIACRAWNVQYNPKTYRALTMRIRKPRATANIFSSGYVVCTGAKSKEQSRMAVRRFARILQKLGFPVSLFNFKIQNVVVTCKTFPVSLERLALAHHQHCSYEPELFPGLFYTFKPGITVTIFASGKMNFTGAKREAEVYEVFHTIYSILSSVRR